MAPCNPSRSEPRAPAMRKLRKPVIEKMRRDRINSSIDQLRILLHKEFPQQQHLPSRAEKAEILEMAVTFLQHHLGEKTAPSCRQSYRAGYSSCVQNSDLFLSLNQQTEAQHKLHIHRTQTEIQGGFPAAGEHTETTKAVWRPW
ncbi:transcription factor HES-5-like [Pelodytes ibericus]